ncbi:6433_t:CDS:2 [Paraglomus brasilianum]|uniref:6433_t:CDS:1 n=1 Tax=Paraglomus brasilianum TaxID=144538 RepID=A0A9N8ZF98_9GLOM|nr:6433_t:CDS:2 [Paraglomus brasilianum]
MDSVDESSSYVAANSVSSLIITTAQEFKKCSELAKTQSLIESIGEEVESNAALFCKTVMNSLIASKIIGDRSSRLVAHVELLGIVCTEIAEYRNVVEVLLNFVRDNENVANGLEKTFRRIYDNLQGCSNNIRDSLETLIDKREELRRLQQRKNKSATKRLFGLGFGIISLVSSILGPEVVVAEATVKIESVSVVTGVFGIITFIDAAARIEQLKKEIYELEIQINSQRTVESLHETLKSATIGVGLVKDYWQKRGVKIEELLKELDSYQQRGQHLNELEAWRFRTKWLNYQKECEDYVEQLWKHIEEHVTVKFTY